MKLFTSDKASKAKQYVKLSNLKFEILNLKYESVLNRGLKIKNFKLKIRDLSNKMIPARKEEVCNFSLI